MDITVPYVLTTPWGTITFNHTGLDRFNSYGEDEYYIGDQSGLDGYQRRLPTDNRPQTHGGLVHTRLRAPRAFVIEGALVIRSTRNSNSNQTGIRRNEMEKDLKDALDSIEDADGTLVWTPRGLTVHSLTVRVHDPEVNFTGIEWETFSFGLIAANPTYV
jgi:hypothetical protein